MLPWFDLNNLTFSTKSCPPFSFRAGSSKTSPVFLFPIHTEPQEAAVLFVNAPAPAGRPLRALAQVSEAGLLTD